jgi:hypothetical protein
MTFIRSISFALLTVVMVSCNFATLISPSKSSSTGKTSDGNVYITGFTIKAADNPTVLTSDIVGSVDSTNNVVSLVLPYKVFDTPVALVPTITTTEGATLNLSGAQDFTVAKSYQVMSADGSSGRTYVTTSSADTGTVNYLTLADPFYLDSSNAKHTVSGYTLSSTIDSYTISVPSTVYSSIASSLVGFDTVTVPVGSTYSSTEMIKLRTGQVLPASATIISPDGTYTKKYTISLRSGTSSDTSVTVSAHVASQQMWSDNVTYSNSSAISTLQNTTVSIPVSDGSATVSANASWSSGSASNTSWTSGSSSASGVGLALFGSTTASGSAYSLLTSTYPTNFAVSGAVPLSWSDTSYGTFSAIVSGTANITISLSSAFTSDDTAIQKAIVAPPASVVGYGAVLRDDGDISIPLSFSNSQTLIPSSSTAQSATDYSPLVYSTSLLTTRKTTSITKTNLTVSSSTLTNLVSHSASISISTPSVTLPSPGTVTTPLTLSFPPSVIRDFTEPEDYYLVYSMSFTKSPYAAFQGLVTNSALVSSYAYSSDGNTLTLTLKDPGTPSVSATGVFTAVAKQTGLVAVFSVKAEDGTITTYTPNLP